MIIHQLCVCKLSHTNTVDSGEPLLVTKNSYFIGPVVQEQNQLSRSNHPFFMHIYLTRMTDNRDQNMWPQ